MAREPVSERKARLERGGAWLREQRLRRSLTQIELAGRLDLDQAKLSAYENGRYAIDVTVARRIALALDLPESRVWRGLELPLPQDLDDDLRRRAEEAWPGAIDAIVAGKPLPPRPGPPPPERDQRSDTERDTRGRSGESEQTA